MKRALVVAALALGACGAPASYDGLTGGAPPDGTVAKEDGALEAPRPVSPISVSLIASSRPRLRWDLATANGNLSGAIVEMSRTRDFAKDVKIFVGKGSELVVPEDLAPGIWFWRLKGTAVGTFGTTPSTTWEMLVRGPAAHGSSDMPTRGMVDVNGDGEPDLLVGATMGLGPVGPGGRSAGSSSSAAGPGASTRSAPTVKEPSSPITLFYPGDRDRGFLGEPTDGYQGYPEDAPYDGPMAFGGGTDFNGDGYTDVIETGTDSYVVQGKRYFDINIVYSSQKADMALDVEKIVPLYLGANSPTFLGSVREGADVDGDGYGDAVIGLADVGYLVLGTKSKKLLSPLVPIYPSADGPVSKATSPRIAMGSFDANGDGLADVVFSLADNYEPSARAFAAAGNRTDRVGAFRLLDSPDAKLATAFAAGDFNGDGIDDIAITTPVGTSTRVCLWFGNREKLVIPGPCVAAPAGDTDFGASLTAADIEGDGVDELLATAKSGDVEGVRVVRLGANGVPTAAPIGVPGLGVRLTTIWPGRPGKARWAAVAADGSRIGVFEGSDLKTSMLPPVGTLRGFGRGLR